MNNEEKILQILTQMQGDITDLKQGQAELKTDVSKLKADVSELKADVSELKADVSELKADVSKLKATVAKLENNVMRIEVEHGKKLDAVFDSYKQLFDISQGIRTDVSYLSSEQGKHDLALRWLHAERIAK